MGSIAVRVAGPAALLFGTIIARTSRTNRAGVWICCPTHAKYKTILSHLLIVSRSTKSRPTVSNVCSRGRLFIGSVDNAINPNPR